LAGGRISTELIRTPADVTVLTREFLNEIGALDYQDAAPYLTSMAQTDPVVTTDFGNKFTVRGLPVGLQMRNYFRVARPVDGYITERLEGLRGPNSLLFGDGALGGGLNTMTKRARPGRDAGEIVLRGDSEGSWYAAADLNRSLGPRTALRANTARRMTATASTWRRSIARGRTRRCASRASTIIPRPITRRPSSVIPSRTTPAVTG
jgi:outer membrane receptor protein involved in Fe transport